MFEFQEEQAAKQKALMESVQAAYDQAQQEKHQKRVQKLAQNGHDINNLRKSWEGKHVIPLDGVVKRKINVS